MPRSRRYTLAELEALPTLHQGHFDNLKVQTDRFRVWLSRMRVEDGMAYNNQVTVEQLKDGDWKTTEQYQAR